jgi:beta-glucosidase
MKKLLLSCLLLLSAGIANAQQVPVYLDASKTVDERIEDALSRMTLDEKIRVIHAQSKFSARGVPRLGLPDFWCDDGPHGIRPNVLWDSWNAAGQTNDSCVAFPALTCLAATWNPALSRRYGNDIGEEARYRGKDMVLGPGMNIYRTPLGGRNFEYLGEDPYLASIMVVPYIQGLQSNGVSACAKHFCLNNDEANRHQVNVIVNDRALHEIYLPAFKAAVQKGKVWAVMCAYNYYNNQPLCANEVLLQNILKKEWQFDGVAITDWGVKTTTDDAVKYGLDMEFGTHTDGLHKGKANAYNYYYLAFPYMKGILEGKYSTKELDEKVRRVLRLYYRTTMNSNRKTGFLCSEEHYATAQKIGEEGIVLLQNKRNLLPLNLTKTKKILVVGENAIKMMTVGGGSSSLKVQREVLPIDGLKARLSKLNIEVDYARGYVGDTTGYYNGVRTGQDLREYRSEKELIQEAAEKAKTADYVIMIGGLNKSEHQDDEGYDRESYELPYHQDALIEALAKANKNFVYVNISGNAVAMPWKDRVPAILQGWFLGSESGEALASVLVGDANPSGKLPFTWPAKLADVGAHALNAYPGIWRADHQMIDEEYKEGLFVGYRWVDLKKTTPAFAFGYGLSYTTFQLSNLRADKTSMTRDGKISFTINVKNTGKRAGAEVVQLYIHDAESSLERPYKELKGFQKVYLEPGESKDVTMTIDNDALSFYDDKAHCWKSETGDFEALVGDASNHITQKMKFSLQ